MRVRGAVGWRGQWKRRQKRHRKIQAEEDRRALATRRIVRYGGEDTIYGRVAALGMTLEICDDGRHWVFRDPGTWQGWGRFVEWWPRRGRLVFDRRYADPFFTKDFDEVIREIARCRTGP